MHKAIFYILELLLKGIARLPFRALYVISDVVYFLLCHVVRYRYKVIRKNIAESFPDKSDDELKRIIRGFYRNFADYIFETVKLLHISDAEIKERLVFENTEPIDAILSQGRTVIAYFSHSFNWEWVTSITLHMNNAPSDRMVFGQVYRPLKNKNFDALMLKIRSRFGSVSFAKSTVLRDLIRLKRDNIVSIDGFMSDQKPSHGDPAYITTFLNHPTAFISGTETLARKLGTAAAYIDMYKVSRGHYRAVLRVIADDVAATEKGEVTKRYVAMLEETITRNPSIWLWSHKRWKIPVTLPQNQ
jgi:KDO2-lipid IV(A) lauroyltransferase